MHSRTTDPVTRLAPLIIALATVWAFAPVLANGFVNWDDTQNLLNNHAYRGLSYDHLRWMFSTTYGGHYQPLSWLSFGIEYRLWGLNAAGIHLTSMLLHAATAIAFFFVCRRLLTPEPRALARAALEAPRPQRESLYVSWASLVAALLFALHPLRVESVAWATERRDVLSGVWLMVSVLCYVSACQGTDSRRRRLLLASVVCFCLSLLSKASGFVLPVVLLLLDWFPLQRFRKDARGERVEPLRRIVYEKLLFAVPATAAAVMAAWAQRQSGAMWTLADHPLGLRIGQALYGVGFYLRKTLSPMGLCPLYEQSPDAAALDWPNVVSAGFVLLATVVVWRLVRRGRDASIGRAVCVAWLVYVVFLGPVLGLVQSGPQVVADRYSYLACLPWAVLAGATLVNFLESTSRRRRATLLTLAFAVVALLGFMTRSQTRVWRDSITLWKTTIARGGSTGIANANLASALNSGGAHEAACSAARDALRTLPGNRAAHVALARCSAQLGDLVTAEREYELALAIAARLRRQDLASVTGLAAVKAQLGKTHEADALYASAVASNPDSGLLRHAYGGFLAGQNRIREAMDQFKQATRLAPSLAGGWYRLAVLQERSGDYPAARATLRRGLSHLPDELTLIRKQAWLLATCERAEIRDGAEALALARRGLTLAGQDDVPLTEALAASHAELGDWSDAVEVLDRLIARRGEAMSAEELARVDAQRRSYKQSTPWRE